MRHAQSIHHHITMSLQVDMPLEAMIHATMGKGSGESENFVEKQDCVWVLLECICTGCAIATLQPCTSCTMATTTSVINSQFFQQTLP